MPTKPKENYKADTIDERDSFQTPPYAVDILAPYLLASDVRTVWEPACGSGYLVRWLERYVLDVYATDIRLGVDYFEHEPSTYDAQITNPPFSLKYKWLARACELGRPFALLMPSDMLFAGKLAQPLIQRYDLRLLVPDSRVDFKTPFKPWSESSAQMHTSWVTYRLGLPERITFCEMRKPDKAFRRRYWDLDIFDVSYAQPVVEQQSLLSEVA